jgi:predicted DNA-binding transcriptional regulator YafY
MAGTPIIRQAGKDQQQVKIKYTNRQGKNITRTIRPYEIKKGYVYATDSVHGAGHIHSFKVSRIQSAEPVERGYKPKWPVKF